MEPKGQRLTFTLRLTPDLHAKLTAAAEASGRTLTTEIIRRIESTFDDGSADSTEARLDQLEAAMGHLLSYVAEGGPGKEALTADLLALGRRQVESKQPDPEPPSRPRARNRR